MPTASLLDGLDDEQRSAVVHPAPPLRIIAGAGAGKTRVLTRRIAYLATTDVVDPRRVMALTFTRKAAGELNNRLRALGMRDAVAAGTFHSMAYAQLRRWWADNDRAAPALVDRKAPLVARVLPRGLGDNAVLDAISEIEWAKARMVSPDQYADAVREADRRTSVAVSQMTDIYRRYEQEKRARRVVDFDDLLALCRRAIETDREFANAQRWRFRHLFVDEFQDVNPAQFALLRAWLGDSGDLCVVGDPRQAIYSWNGADASYINDFPNHFPGAATVVLRHNYRSTPQVLAVAHAVLDGASDLAPSLATRPAGPSPMVHKYESELYEARSIARSLRDHHGPGRRWSEQGVLVRTNAQLAAIEEALRRAGIPFRTRGGGLLRLPEARNLIRGFERSRAPLSAVIDDLRDPTDGTQTDSNPAGDSGDDDAGTDTSRAIRDSLLRLANECLALDPTATAASFAGWIHATASGEDVADDADAVDLATFHAAKGLEWRVVHIAGLEQGLVPISYARTPDALAEEQRLLYVALTRAEEIVRCSWAAERTFGNRPSSRSPSPHLASITGAIDELAGRPRAVDQPARARRERAQLSGRAANKSAPSDPLTIALRRWRSDAARAANVPAYVIFNDATLDAIVSTKPRTKVALGRVPGIGPVKLDRFADAVLRIVAEN